MRNPILLATAAYRASLSSSLFEVILEKAAEENVSEVLTDLICIAWVMNDEILHSLDKEVGND